MSDSEIARIPHIERATAVVVKCHVFETKSDWSRGPRPNFETCKCREELTDELIENVPCAGLDLKPGDVIEVTIRRMSPEKLINPT